MSTDVHSDPYEAKVDFSGIYNQMDPRPYYRTLHALEYQIPAHGAPVFERLLEGLGGREGKTVLDVCCGYGVNAALLNHAVELHDLYEHYARIDPAADSGDLEEADRRWFATRRRPDAVSTIGLDIAANAVRYATSVNLVDCGVVANLETDVAGSQDLQTLARADLVTVTGGIGYIGEKTFRAIVEAGADEPPWIAALNLRWVDFKPIAQTLEELGLVTERLEGYCVPQRRFANERERRAVLAGLSARGLDPTEELRIGAHCAELLVARPPQAVQDVRLDDLLRS